MVGGCENVVPRVVLKRWLYEGLRTLVCWGRAVSGAELVVCKFCLGVVHPVGWMWVGVRVSFCVGDVLACSACGVSMWRERFAVLTL